MDLKTLVIKLREKGLWVVWDERKSYFFCAIKTDDPCGQEVISRFGRRVYVQKVVDGDSEFWICDELYITQKSDHWKLVNYPEKRDIGAPVPEKFGFDCKTELDVLEVCLRYYFREPIVIEGWNIPVYQYPKWKVETIQKVVQNASRIGQYEIEQILKEKHLTQLVRSHDGSLLYLTLDGENAYSVETPK